MSDRELLFLFAKDGIVKVLRLRDGSNACDTLKGDGWTHTLTVDAALWVEHLLNEPEALAGRVAEAQGIGRADEGGSDRREDGTPAKPAAHSDEHAPKPNGES